MIILLITTLCLHSALSSAIAEEENKEGRINDIIRTTFSSGGALYLGLNSTVLWVAVLGLGVLGLAAYLGLTSGLLGGAEGSGYNQRYSNFYDPDLQAANSPTALAALAYAQEAQAAQNASARSKRALDESKFKIYCISINTYGWESYNMSFIVM